MLSNVAPWVLHILLGEPDDPETKPEGAQLKINFLLDRLPRLKSGIDPAVAFAGTLHVGSEYSAARGGVRRRPRRAAAGDDPRPRCTAHSLTDPSILGDVPPGSHTLTYFGLHTPASVFASDPDGAATKPCAGRSPHSTSTWSTRSSRSWPATAQGNPCIEARIPQDIEAELAMPGGHIYHGDLDWPWANNRARLDTPAQQWGVPTGLPGVPVRVGRAPRRRGLRHRRPQRRAGGAGQPLVVAVVVRCASS